jgi:hypothetical protein
MIKILLKLGSILIFCKSIKINHLWILINKITVKNNLLLVQLAIKVSNSILKKYLKIKIN